MLSWLRPQSLPLFKSFFLLFYFWSMIAIGETLLPVSKTHICTTLTNFPLVKRNLIRQQLIIFSMTKPSRILLLPPGFLSLIPISLNLLQTTLDIRTRNLSFLFVLVNWLLLTSFIPFLFKKNISLRECLLYSFHWYSSCSQSYQYWFQRQPLFLSTWSW